MELNKLKFVMIFVSLHFILCQCIEEEMYHSNIYARDKTETLHDVMKREKNRSYWYDMADARIHLLTERWKDYLQPKAKNAIFFVGDGLSLSTLVATRVLLGQRAGASGEESTSPFDRFPVTGFAKTYCVDAQIPDSACTAAALVLGLKTSMGLIGVTANVTLNDCGAAADVRNHVESIADVALKGGLSVGLVTTARVTHATPSNLYAHSANRDMESDADLTLCRKGIQKDIAMQLITEYPGNQFKVILGGGRREFISEKETDQTRKEGRRKDRLNLIKLWLDEKYDNNMKANYVWNLNTLRAARKTHPDYLLGLFASSHLEFHELADNSQQPTLTELVETAVEILSRNKKGFYLFVEGGRIDHAHHLNMPKLALDESAEMALAVEAAKKMTGQDTLIVVTADHSHVMGFAGYTGRGNDILGPSSIFDVSGQSYMTLSYINGPGARNKTCSGVRANVVFDKDFDSLEWKTHADIPLTTATHGGEDVAVFASGPNAILFSGHYEQHILAHLVQYILGLGGFDGKPGLRIRKSNDANKIKPIKNISLVLILILVILKKY